MLKMNQLFVNKISSSSWIDDAVYGKEDLPFGRALDFHRRKQWIDSIVEELQDNLELFFSVMTGIQNFRSKLKQIESRKEIAQLVRLNADNLIDGLRLIHKDMKLSKIEVFYNVLKSS